MSWFKPATPESSGGGLEIVTWADGTDEQIAAMLEAHYNDEIDIHDYWAVGDERTVRLSAMSAYGLLDDTHVEQDVTFVLLHEGGAELTTPINGHTECAFIVGQKDYLIEHGRLDYSQNGNGWPSQQRSIWCNETYKNALPSTLRNIFKSHAYYFCRNYSDSSVYRGDCFFRFPSAKELLGPGTPAADMSLGNYVQLDYYKTLANRTKGVYNYWTISKFYYLKSTQTGNRYKFYVDNGSVVANTNTEGLAPQGVI